MQKGFAYSKLADRLASVADLSAGDLDLLAKMPITIGHFSSHENVLRKGDRPNCCSLLLQGYLCWKDAGNRGGQITSIYVAGDVPDLSTLIWPTVGADLSALGPTVVAFVPHHYLHEITSLSASMARALSLLGVAEAALLRNWIVNLGSRDSLTRVAHLICEIAMRLRAVGQAHDDRFPSPFTQSDLADACGISAVHANRVIQELRRKSLIHWQSRTIGITHWRGLVDLASFKPDYLCLRNTNDAGSDRPIRSFAAEDSLTDSHAQS